jgi:biopolymer transport protein ExbD
MRLPDEPDLPFQINIVPMIDVIFAILTFFIMSSLFLSNSSGLPVNLPKAGSAQKVPFSRVTVTINARGKISVNQRSLKLRDLQPHIRKLNGKSRPLIIINADEQVKHGQVVAVMDQLRRIPGVKLSIAAKP